MIAVVSALKRRRHGGKNQNKPGICPSLRGNVPQSSATLERRGELQPRLQLEPGGAFELDWRGIQTEDELFDSAGAKAWRGRLYQMTRDRAARRSPLYPRPPDFED